MGQFPEPFDHTVYGTTQNSEETLRRSSLNDFTEIKLFSWGHGLVF